MGSLPHLKWRPAERPLVEVGVSTLDEKLDIQLPTMVADMGYLDGQDKIAALKIYNTVVFTEVKKDMIRPEVCDEQGRMPFFRVLFRDYPFSVSGSLFGSLARSKSLRTMGTLVL